MEAINYRSRCKSVSNDSRMHTKILDQSSNKRHIMSKPRVKTSEYYLSERSSRDGGTNNEGEAGRSTGNTKTSLLIDQEKLSQNL